MFHKVRREFRKARLKYDKELHHFINHEQSLLRILLHHLHSLQHLSLNPFTFALVKQELGYEYSFYLFYQSFIGSDLLLKELPFCFDVKLTYASKILSSFNRTQEYDRK